MKQIIIATLIFLALPIGLHFFLVAHHKSDRNQEPEKSLVAQKERDSLYKKETRDGKMELAIKETGEQKEFNKIGNIVLEIESLWKRGDVEQLYLLINQEYLRERQLSFHESDMKVIVSRTVEDLEGKKYTMLLQNVARLSKYYLVQIRFLYRESGEPELIYDQNKSKDITFLLFLEEGGTYSFLPFLPDDLSEPAEYRRNEYLYYYFDIYHLNGIFGAIYMRT